MSQLVKAIAATDTRERKFIPGGLSPLFTSYFSSNATSEETYHTGEVLTAYRIEARIGAQVLAKQDADLAQAIVRTKQNVVEAIFGEFRSQFRMIDDALNRYDVEEARKILHKFEDQMFSIEK